MMYTKPITPDELYHHGIKGQKWGIRRFQNYDGTLKRVGKRLKKTKNRMHSLNRAPISAQYYKKYDMSKKEANSEAEKTLARRKKIAKVALGVGVTALAAYGAYKIGVDYADVTLKAGTKLQTLSHDKNRMKAGTAFYTNFKDKDKRIYEGLFGGKGGNLKWAIENTVQKDMKIASNHSAKKIFEEMNSNDNEFHKYFANAVMDNKNQVMGYQKRNATAYDIMNAVILPQDTRNGRNQNAAKARDMFYAKLKERGYAGLKDVNDIKFSNLRAHSPTIMFDLDKVKQTNIRKLTRDEVDAGEKIAKKLAPIYTKLYDSEYMLVTGAAAVGTGASTMMSISDEMRKRELKKKYGKKNKSTKS